MTADMLRFKIKLPRTVNKIISELNARGFEAYIVGGCVRDAVTGHTPSDWDIAASSEPAETKAVFSRFKTADDGIKHGTVRVIIYGKSYEITTFRTDGPYTDDRRPDFVVFTKSIEADLSRRDFTINAMAYSPSGGLIDPFRGAEDIQRKVIRCVGDPEMRFSEDALRILRALRFSSVLGYTIEEKTLAAARALAGTLRNISSERVTAEFLKLVSGGYAHRVYSYSIDILRTVIPELPCSADTERALKAAPADAALRLALIFPDLSLARKCFSALRPSNALSSRVCAFVALRDSEIPDTLPKARRFLSALPSVLSADEVIAYWRALGCEVKAAAELFSNIAANNDCTHLSQLALKGDELTALGIPPEKSSAPPLNFCSTP